MPRRNKTPLYQQFIYHESCSNKRRYKNEIDAQKIAELQMLENMNLELSVYKCHECRFWHLTRINTELP